MGTGGFCHNGLAPGTGRGPWEREVSGVECVVPPGLDTGTGLEKVTRTKCSTPGSKDEGEVPWNQLPS